MGQGQGEGVKVRGRGRGSRSGGKGQMVGRSDRSFRLLLGSLGLS